MAGKILPFFLVRGATIGGDPELWSVYTHQPGEPDMNHLYTHYLNNNPDLRPDSRFTNGWSATRATTGWQRSVQVTVVGLDIEANCYRVEFNSPRGNWEIVLTNAPLEIFEGTIESALNLLSTFPK